MRDQIFHRLRAMFDVPQMQNSLRGLWAEAMVAELIGEGWRFTGGDWAAWDFERERDGFRLEVKQSASRQSWGTKTRAPRFDIAASKGYYSDTVTYIENHSGGHLADVYVFAWHDGQDQRDPGEWAFFVILSKDLPLGQKSIGLNSVRKIATAVGANQLKDRVEALSR